MASESGLEMKVPVLHLRKLPYSASVLLLISQLYKHHHRSEAIATTTHLEGWNSSGRYGVRKDTDYNSFDCLGYRNMHWQPALRKTTEQRTGSNFDPHSRATKWYAL